MNRRTMLRAFIALPLLLGCGGPRDARAATETYRTEGTVRWIASDRTRVRIRHEDIPGFMRAMTMPFDVSPKLIVGLNEGARVKFTFEVRADDALVITSLQKVGP